MRQLLPRRFSDMLYNRYDPLAAALLVPTLGKAKAHALLAGRFAVAPEDIKRVAHPVLRHRVLPNFAAEAEGITAEQVIDEILSRISPPRSDIGL